MSTNTVFEGQWRMLVNRSTQGGTNASIHDDAQARSLGFRRGFVVGSTVATAALPAIVDRYGKQWFEGGWYSFKFITPVYDDEEVREIAADDDGELAVRVEARDGRLCAAGRAGLGDRVPWDTAQDGTRNPDSVLPRMRIGLEYAPMPFTIAMEDTLSTIRAAREESPWYTEKSPFGNALVPPEHMMSVINRSRGATPPLLDGVKPQQIWAEHSVVMSRPLLVGTSYVAHTRVVDKGQSGRAAYYVEELEVRDDAGARVARARSQTKHLLDG